MGLLFGAEEKTETGPLTRTSTYIESLQPFLTQFGQLLVLAIIANLGFLIF